MTVSRRQLLKVSIGALLSGAASPGSSNSPGNIITRKIPATGEAIPVIGMGTWITFNVGDNPAIRQDRCKVLEKFFQMGGVMVDSSPMYGSSEEVVGYCTTRIETPQNFFPTTKVWTSSDSEGRNQIDDSFGLWRTNSFGLFQVHNLVNWESHLPYLLELKQQGRIRYVGISTSHGRRHQELEQIMNSQKIDFVQLTYNLQDRAAEKRLLPLAADKGIGVVVNRPFRRGGLFDRIGGQPLPGWAGEIGCENMAQIMLKFIVSHPSVTCAIPATSQVAHMAENMGAQQGPLPDGAMRQQMINWFASI